ncbi:hypothetical protein [Labrenzia sp. 011]|uniref:hypothetical protein n=1 Tax=Labrenzia sp. 011 TaxID=2171494 RepID=UPI000D5203FB|nr:hypothetical protein [Labrenzia sp. 011]PVB60456.1 hypothetical protein DCO57_16790 [Labrenzia sp. 011]
MYIDTAAQLIAKARCSGTQLDRLPEDCRPRNVSDGYVAQATVAEALGLAVAGWKVAAHEPGTGVAAPIFAGTVHHAPVSLVNVDILETEIAFRLGRDLPIRSRDPYSRHDILAAIQGFTLAFELVGRRFAASGLALPERIADCFANAGLILGKERPFMGDIPSPVEGVSLLRNGRSEPFQPIDIDPVESIRSYVNCGGDRLGGLRAGQWVITGSLTGMQEVSGPESWTARWRDELEVSLEISDSI